MSFSQSMGQGDIAQPERLKFYLPEGDCQTIESKLHGDCNIEQRVALHKKRFQGSTSLYRTFDNEFP